MPRGRQSGIAYGQKKQQGASDTAQLIAIISRIAKRYKIKPMREPHLLFNIQTDRISKIKDIKDGVTRKDLNDNYQKRPDILWLDKYGMWVIEIDGSVHDRNTEKTLKRNELFIRNHIKLIVVNISDIKELGLNIYDYIDDKILEHIRG